MDCGDPAVALEPDAASGPGVTGDDACARYFALMVQEDGDPGAGILHLSRLAAFERR